MGDAKPKGSPSLLGRVVARFSLSGWWHVVKTLDAIAKARGENGITITKADAGWVFSAGRKVGSSDSTGMTYTGEFDQLSLGDPDDPYLSGEVTRVSSGNDASSVMGGPTVPGVYICIQDNPGADDYPRHPLQDGGETAFWQWLSTWPSAERGCVGGEPADIIRDSQVKPVVPE